MQRLFTLALAAAAASAAASANADILDAKFVGTVSTQSNTSFAVGASISGEFLYDTASARYTSFTIGGQPVAPGFASSASLTPDLFSALYQAQVSPLQGGTLNSTFNVDLEGVNPWAASSAVALLTNAAQLASNLDTTLSQFSYYMANADGTGVHSITASLKTLQVSAVPEPSTVALMLVGFAAAARRVVRRKGVPPAAPLLDS